MTTPTNRCTRVEFDRRDIRGEESDGGESVPTVVARPLEHFSPITFHLSRLLAPPLAIRATLM
jgi:hypothetical protein